MPSAGLETAIQVIKRLQTRKATGIGANCNTKHTENPKNDTTLLQY